MAYQLIYTSALHLLDSNTAGYGVVARSENLSKSLCIRLCALSVFREPRGGSNSTGPQFSYHILDHAGTSWHVLTCVQQAGADYSGRNCFTAHHMLLTPEEVQQLLQHKLRPTPAGLTLALHKSGFWVRKWQGSPRFITQEPSPAPDSLPDASMQPTWKRLTGHKSNARAFFTSPFDRDCLITIAPGTASTEILQLFHESDWLTHSRGWGATYTTETDEADSFAETLRMVTAPTSPLVQRALRTSHPVLEIARDMEIPQPEPLRPQPGSMPEQPYPEHSEKSTIMRTLARSVSHYHYTEEPDWLLYDVRPARPRLIPGAAAILGTVACLSVAGWYYLNNACDTRKPEFDTHPNSSELASADHVQMLAALLREEYDHSATEECLKPLAALPGNTPDDALVLESASLILKARNNGAQHASVLRRLCECARLLGLKDVDLVRLYLNEATSDKTPEDWQKQFDGSQVSDWINLKLKEPQIIALLESEHFKPYALVIPHQQAQATILAAADTTSQEEEEAEDTAPAPDRISLIPAAAVSGKPLPPELERVIPELPVSIHTGRYVVSTFSKGGDLGEPKKLDLSPDGYHLSITPTENAGEFLLKPGHNKGLPVPMPEARFVVRAGRLQQIQSEGAEAVVCFPVPTHEDFHTNVVLASAFGIPVPTGKMQNLPPAAQAGLDIQPENLVLETGSHGGKTPQVRLKAKSTFPWTLGQRDINNLRFSITLPVLTGHNSLQFTGPESATFAWKEAKVTKETDSGSTIRCKLERRPDLPGRLLRAFERVINTPCCGEVELKDKSMTLGHLYYICCALANDKLSRKEKRQLHKAYFSLFANKQFNKVLMRVLAQDTMLHITPDEAVSNKFKAIQARTNITKLLGDRNTRDLIRQRVCEVLTRTMYAAYTQEQKAWEQRQNQPPVLLLNNISSGSHVELLWQFTIAQKSQ